MSNKDKSKDGAANFTIQGELTIYRVAELKDIIFSQINSADLVEINLSHVTELDSAGLQLLLSAKLEAMIRDKQLHFVGHSKPVVEVFDLCDLGGFFGDQVVIFPHTQN